LGQRHETKTIDLPDAKNGIIAVISDTHGRPHPNLFPILEQHHPSLILHAGDIGDLDLITELEAVSQTIYARGNVDPAGPVWPDSVALRIRLGMSFQLDLLLVHIAVARFKLNHEVLTLLQQSPAQIVVFGHSHVPFLGRNGKIGLFNPGSAGPSRMGLPTTMGFIEIRDGHLRFEHLDLRTGLPWKPTSQSALPSAGRREGGS
jgi:putative phosphoesterase